MKIKRVGAIEHEYPVVLSMKEKANIDKIFEGPMHGYRELLLELFTDLSAEHGIAVAFATVKPLEANRSVSSYAFTYAAEFVKIGKSPAAYCKIKLLVTFEKD